MATNISVKVPRWFFDLTYERDGLQWALSAHEFSPMNVGVSIEDINCDTGVLPKVIQVSVAMPSFPLAPGGGSWSVDHFPLSPALNQSYLTQTRIDVSDVRLKLLIQLGTFWASCTPPQGQMGMPRFAARARWRVEYKAATTVYRQQYAVVNGQTRWSDPVKDDAASVPQRPVVREPPIPIVNTDATQIHSCKKCIALPAGAPNGKWIWADSHIHPA